MNGAAGANSNISGGDGADAPHAAVIARKNFLFANTPSGAESSTVLFSLIETAKEEGLDPYRYLVWLFREAPGRFCTDRNWTASLLPQCAPAECRTHATN